jgi:hypothetical protein
VKTGARLRCLLLPVPLCCTSLLCTTRLYPCFAYPACFDRRPVSTGHQQGEWPLVGGQSVGGDGRTRTALPPYARLLSAAFPPLARPECRASVSASRPC